MGAREPRFSDGNQRLQYAMDLLESGMSVSEVSRITGYAERSIRNIKSDNFKNNNYFDENKFHKEWTEAVNKFRKAAGLPLFRVGGGSN